MKKITLILTLVLAGLTLNAQKVKVKKGIVTVNKLEYLRMKADRLTGDFYFYDLGEKGDELIYAKYVEYNDPNVYNERPERWNGSWNYHEVSYYEIYIAGTNDFFEADIYGKYIAKMVYNANLIDMAGNVDSTKTKLFLSRRGKEHTRRREEIKNTQEKVIVIENRTAPAPQPRRNRIGVRLGGFNIELND